MSVPSSGTYLRVGWHPTDTCLVGAGWSLVFSRSLMIDAHLVWDWNGTLLDDLGIVVEAVNHSTAAFGLNPITANDYRDHYTRPVRDFYDRLFGRTIDDDGWLLLNYGYHDTY